MNYGKLKAKKMAVALGASGLPIPQSGLRPESFEYLRRGGKPIPSLPVMIAVYPDGQRVIVDGRHRITIGREQGKSTVQGTMIGYGPRLGVVWRYTGKIPI
jgi:hypothetical protein